MQRLKINNEIIESGTTPINSNKQRPEPVIPSSPRLRAQYTSLVPPCTLRGGGSPWLECRPFFQKLLRNINWTSFGGRIAIDHLDNVSFSPHFLGVENDGTDWVDLVVPLGSIFLGHDLHFQYRTSVSMSNDWGVCVPFTWQFLLLYGSAIDLYCYWLCISSISRLSSTVILSPSIFIMATQWINKQSANSVQPFIRYNCRAHWWHGE